MKTIYRIQKRKFSSDVIEFSINEGKTWSVLIIPTIKKNMGDALAEEILDLLIHDSIGIDLENNTFYDQ